MAESIGSISSTWFDTETLAVLRRRLRRPPSRSSVPGSLPVLFFGDLPGARIATVGLKPSRREYLDPSGRELTGALRRFETLESVGAPRREDLTDDQVDQAIRTMRAYQSEVVEDQQIDVEQAAQLLLVGGVDASGLEPLEEQVGPRARATSRLCARSTPSATTPLSPTPAPCRRAPPNHPSVDPFVNEAARGSTAGQTSRL